MSTSFPPAVRLRRLRQTPAVRRMLQEVSCEPRHLVQPYFVVSGTGVRKEARPGSALFQISADLLCEEAGALERAGVGGLMLFGVPDMKTEDGANLDAQLAPLVAAVGSLKKRTALPVFADVCLCSYTTTGHCGLVKNGEVVNDASVAVLSKMSVALARAGVDYVCPSDMMDGRVAAIRRALDEAGQVNTSIVSYAVKMASAFYGPFRLAADSAPQFGDRAGYQMPAGNRREARREWKADEAEGADLLLFKPALSNLDLIRDAREESDLPLVAYQVSGEYAMLRASADAGLLDFDRAMTETLTSIRRAGADLIVSYHARKVAGL
jgi:porphobilinogen synthase